jgi:hypothetical protein
MKVSLNKYNNEEKLDEVCIFLIFNLKSPLKAFRANLIFTPQVLRFMFV